MCTESRVSAKSLLYKFIDIKTCYCDNRNLRILYFRPFFQAHFRQVTGNNLVLLFKCRCITAILLFLGLSHVSTLASYELRTFTIEKIPEALLYTYLTALRYLTALYWYFTFAASSCSADLLEQSLSKVSEGSSVLSGTFIRSGQGSSVSIATDYGLGGPGIESRWGRVFPYLSRPVWGPPSLLYNGYRVFPRSKERPGSEADPSPPSSAVVKKE